MTDDQQSECKMQSTVRSQSLSSIIGVNTTSSVRPTVQMDNFINSYNVEGGYKLSLPQRTKSVNVPQIISHSIISPIVYAQFAFSVINTWWHP